MNESRDSIVRGGHRTHLHRVLADAYIRELGESESQVGARLETMDPAGYEAEDITFARWRICHGSIDGCGGNEYPPPAEDTSHPADDSAAQNDKPAYAVLVVLQLHTSSRFSLRRNQCSPIASSSASRFACFRSV